MRSCPTPDLTLGPLGHADTHTRGTTWGWECPWRAVVLHGHLSLTISCTLIDCFKFVLFCGICPLYRYPLFGFPKTIHRGQSEQYVWAELD